MALDEVDVPPAFLALWDHAEQLVSSHRGGDERRLHVLPPSLTTVAELVEDGPTFHAFLDAGLWDAKPSPWRIREVLRRAGFYQAVHSRRDPQAVWQAVDARLRPSTARVRTFALLDGCRFPLERFRVDGVLVERPSREQLQGLGPPIEVAQVFFPREILDPDWYTQAWFLVKEDDRQVKPSSIPFRFGYDVLAQFFEPILALALYKIDYFALPIVLESNPGWCLERVQWSQPMVKLVDDGSGNAEEIPYSDYDVQAEEQQRFGEFVTFFDNAIQAARGWRMFKVAARRYLRAIRIAGFHPSSRDDYEDALLQYVFALEAIFLMGDTTAISDKLATRAAWLIGTDDRVRNETFTAVKDLYHARSSVVHGTTSKSRAVRSYELDGVRDLLRRSLVGLLAVRSAAESEDECIRLLKTAAFDRGSQSHIAGATEPVWRLIDSCPEWRRNGWGPKYEPYAPF